jgi:uncharacterized membrane protein YgdD (TMEM256/DUF423 family)
MQRSLVRFAGYSGALAVALGAMGAHYLKGKMADGLLTADNLEAYHKAVLYHMIHTLAILAIAVLGERLNKKAADYAAIFFITGIALFSGSVYILSTRGLYGMQEGLKWLGPVTPMGGVLFIAGWIMLAMSAYKKKGESNGEKNG